MPAIRRFYAQEHRQVQANCPHLIAYAVDNQRRQAMAHCLAIATRYGDAVGVLVCIAQTQRSVRAASGDAGPAVS